MLGKERVREIACKYAEEVRKIFNPTRIILFGSYANGTPHEWSDIDIAVLVNDIKDEDWYDSRIMLQGILYDKNAVENFTDIEPHLLDETYDPSGFVEHVIKTGEVVYQA